jgi:hypothetical protein
MAGTKKDISAMEGFTRKTYIVNEELSNKIDAISYWGRSTLKDVVFEMQTAFIKAWEKKNGTLKPIPGKK